MRNSKRLALAAAAGAALAFAACPAAAQLLLTGAGQGTSAWWSQFATSALYVSNAASNGFALGNDTTGNGTKAAPYLTVDKAATVAADGQAIDLNPGGAPYIQNSSGLGYLNLPATKALAIGCDPKLGQAVLQATGARVVLYPTTAKPEVLYNLAIDGGSTSSGNGVTTGNMTGGLTIQATNFRNLTGSAIVHPTLTGNIITLAGSDFESTVHFVLSSTGGNYTALTFNGNTFAQDNQVYKGAPGGSVGTFTAVGNHFVGQGTTLGITLSGETIGTMTFSGNDGVGAFAGALLNISGSTPITTLLTVNSNTGSPSGGVFNNGSENISVAEVAYNNASNAVGSTSDAFSLHLVPAVMNFHDNVSTVYSTAQTHGFEIGNDGLITDATNTTATTTQSLGQATGNAYVDQAFTTGPTTGSIKASNVANVLATIKKVGSPTGTITAVLEADNSGVAGTVVDTSTTSVSAASLTTTAVQYGWVMPAHYKTTPGVKYHVVWRYTGTIDGANYVQFSSNATVTGGYLSTSADGSTWTASTGSAILYGVQTGSFATTNVNIYNNKVYVQAGASATTHGFLNGAYNVNAYYRNEVYNSAIGHLFKNTYGGLIYDNIATASRGQQAAFYMKGAVSYTLLQNTGITTSTAGATTFGLLNSSDTGMGTNAPIASGTSKNNIWIASGTGYPYSIDLGSPVTINNDLSWCQGSCPGPGDNHTPTWAAFVARGFNANGVNANPNLPAASLTGSITATDFRPPTGSAAGAIGANVQSQVPKDFLGAGFSTTPPAGALNLGP